MTIGQIARQLARELRKNPTSAEKRLWQPLRDKQFRGFRFLRQHPIFVFMDNRKRFFIADFYCHELLLVIEVDGEIHRRQTDYDEMRTQILRSKQLEVIRFTNEDILNDLNKVLIRLNALVNVLLAKRRGASDIRERS